MKFYFGEDTYTLHQAVEKLKKDAKKSGVDVREVRVGPEDGDESLKTTLGEALQSQGLFSSEQIVFLNDFIERAGQFPKTEKFVIDLSESGGQADDNLVVLEKGKVDKRKKLYKALLKTAEVKEFNIPIGKDLEQWIVGYLSENSFQIETDALQKLVELVGADDDKQIFHDLWQVGGELEKLMLYAGEEKIINRKCVEDVVSEKMNENVFALTNYFAEGKLVEATGLVERIVGRGSSADIKAKVIQLIGALAGQIRSLLLVASVSGGSKQIAKKLGWKEGRVWINQKLAQRFKQKKLESMLFDLQAIDRRIKTSDEPEKLLLTLFIQKAK